MNPKIMAVRMMFMGMEYLKQNKITDQELEQYERDGVFTQEELAALRETRLDARQAAQNA
ncbi:MAG: hypothetical protein AAF542_17925 [Pseudomonadota bacterium]